MTQEQLSARAGTKLSWYGAVQAWRREPKMIHVMAWAAAVGANLDSMRGIISKAPPVTEEEVARLREKLPKGKTRGGMARIKAAEKSAVYLPGRKK